MKIQFYSDTLNKYFDDKAECLAAEREFEQKHAAEIKAKEERTARAKEVEAAWKNYLDLRAKFIEDYKQWHCTITDKDLPALNTTSVFDLFEGFFR